MANYDLLVLNGIVVTDTEMGERDIAIKDEMIVQIVPRGMLSGSIARRTLDAKGGYVMVILNSLSVTIEANR